MPSINDITEAIGYLTLDAIDVREDLCVAVRNRNSRCKRCIDSCIADAIEVSHNEVKVDNSLCVNCGSCIAVCPDNALRAKEPTAAGVTKEMIVKLDASNRCIIACARKAAKREVDSSCYCEVPCLAHLDEVQLLEVIAKGGIDLMLVDGNCETCKYGLASNAINETVEQASRLLDITSSDAIITRSSSFPEDLDRIRSVDNRGEDRRGLFKQTGSYMKSVATNVMQKTMESKLDPSSSNRSLRNKIAGSRAGTLKAFEPKRNHRIIDALETIGLKGGDDRPSAFDTRHFGSVAIDVERCSGCGMCVLFCPTQALRYNEFDMPPEEGRRYVEFSASECTQCSLCEDVCIRRCLKVGSVVEVDDVFELEPVNLEISKPLNRTTIEAMAKRAIGSD